GSRLRQALGFALFDTPIGECAMAWDEDALLAVHLPMATPSALRARMRSRCSPAQEADPPPFVRAAMRRVQCLLEGEADDLADLPLALELVPEFHRRVYAIT